MEAFDISEAEVLLVERVPKWAVAVLGNKQIEEVEALYKQENDAGLLDENGHYKEHQDGRD